ncbi:FAD:protein FMN transferase [Leptothrix ochracea]|uniref:FAD:protein FMN transferase n=1 Tax=Leptothrix ochracea TaxID=735331 RepID=UPI0034E2DE29
MEQDVVIEAVAEGWRGRFEAMASPCEMLLDGGDEALATMLTRVAQAEAVRIERAFSRYRSDSVVARIHAARGRPIEVDVETAALLDFAAQCYEISEGLFDITSGVLRHAWRFDGSDRVPSPQAVSALRERVGWTQLTWQRPILILPEGMEIDFGGIGKEYAVDRVMGLMRARTDLSVLINFGGDLAVSGPRAQGAPWRIGVEQPDACDATVGVLHVYTGAITTSGDARRFLLKDGVRYGHILDPRTGCPVAGAPRSVTVAAPTCTEAGLLSTMALLQGPRAGQFLSAEGVPHWILW